MTFWDVVRSLCLVYLLVAFLWVIFWIAGDVLRNEGTSALSKALWLVVLLFLPFVTVCVYLVVSGRGLSERLAEREASKGYPGYSHSYR
jgi:hypothetical protein